MAARTRYAVVGCGARAGMYVHAASVPYAEHAELVALCDPSQVRMGFWNRLRGHWKCEPVPTYHSDDFARMLSPR